VSRARRLVICHVWASLLCVAPAIVLGVWQMLMRSPLPAPLDDPNRSYASVTAHGSIMASVFPTLVAMGFGDAITVPTLARPLKGQAWAWVGFWLCVIGTAMAVVPVAMGRSSVLYTLSPPLIGSPWYDLGVVLVVLGSSWWIAVTRVNLRSWKREHPGQPVPLGLGGLGGLVQMSSAMHAMVHNTAWVTAHLHLIFGGAVVRRFHRRSPGPSSTCRSARARIYRR
jgi:cytochrome c oxidase subunit I